MEKENKTAKFVANNWKWVLATLCGFISWWGSTVLNADKTDRTAERQDKYIERFNAYKKQSESEISDLKVRISVLEAVLNCKN